MENTDCGDMKEKAKPDATNKVNIQCRTFRRRWMMLTLFCLCSACNASHWIQYSIITNIVSKYYSVSTMAVDWTSIIFMAVYIPLVFPASWVLQKKGLKVAVVLGAFLLFVGSWVKVFSAAADRFAVGFAGQTIIGISQMFTLGAPARLAATWFPHHQVSTATAIGVFGNQAGIAIGFLLPPLIVKEHFENIELIGENLHSLFLGTAILATVIFIFILCFFQAAPPVPPSMAQKLILIKDNRKKGSFYSSLKRLVCNTDFDLLLMTYGINIGTFNAFSTLLNQLVIYHFPGRAEDAGRLGLTLITGGIIGSLVWGVVLDKTRLYKATTVGVNLASTIVLVALAYSLHKELLTNVYIASVFLGFFMYGFVIVGYEFGAELTYPESEGTPSGLLNASGELCGVIFAIGAGIVLKRWGPLVTSMSLSAMLLFGFVLCLFIDGTRLKRSAATKQANHDIPILQV